MEPPAPDMARRAPWPIKAVFALGLALLALALAIGIGRARFLASSVAAPATISAVSDEWMRDLDNRTRGHGARITVTFQDGGRTVSVRSPVVSTMSRARIGDRVEVDYPAGQPERAVIATFADRWLLPAILAFIGGIATLIGGLGLWMVSQPGVRLYGNGRTAIVMRLAPQGGRGPRTAPILVAVIAAATIGFVAAWALRGTAGGVADVRAAGDAAPAVTPAAGGHYPSHLTVEAPPMTAIATPAPAGTGNGAALTAMARAFLARAERDRAMQAALRAKAATLPGLCPSLAFVPGETLVAATPPPMFDAAGRLRRGLIRQRFTGTGCADAEPRFNLWIFAADPDAPIRTVAGYMGTTHADPALQRDATPIVLAIAARLVPGCATLEVLDTRLPAGSPAAAVPGPWREEWLVGGCARYVQATLHFLPAAGGTRIEVPSTEARLIGASGRPA